MMTKFNFLKNRHITMEVFLIFILSLVPLLWLSNGVILGHDSGFRLNPLIYYQNLFYSWNTIGNFGSDWSLYHGFLLVQLPETLFMFLTNSFEIGQKITFIYWFFLMGISMYVLVNSIFPDKKNWPFRLFASIFYMYNFYILQGWFIAERAKFSLYAALPIALLILYNLFVKNSSIFKSAILFSLVYFFLNGGGSPPLYGGTIALLVTAFIIFTLFKIKKNGLSGLFFGIKSGIVFSITLILTNFYWLLPQIGLFRSSYSNALGTTGGVEGLLSWEKIISKYASYSNLFRFQGIPDWYNNPIHQYANAFLTRPILIIASLIPILLISLGLLSGKIRQEKLPIKIFILAILIIYIIGIFFTSGSHAPFGIVYEYLMRHVPGFAIFRSSFYKFGSVVWFSGALLTGYYFNSFLEYIKNRRIRLLLGGVGILLLLLYNYPYFVSNIFRFHELFSTRVQVPAYIGKTINFTNSNLSSQDRFLMLPELNPGFYGTLVDTYKWGYFSLDLLPRNSMNRTIIANDHTAGDLIKSVYKSLYDNQKEAFLKVLGKMGIRYVLWRGDVQYNEQYKEGRNKETYFANLLTYKPKIVNNNGDWSIYGFESSSLTPLIYTPTNLELSEGNMDDYGVRLIMDSEDRNIVDNIYAEGKRNVASISDKTVSEAKCMFCGKNDFEQRVNALPVPNLKYLPGSPLFKYSMSKEAKLLENTNLTTPQIIDIQISKLNTRISLFVYFAENSSSNNKQLLELMKEYELMMNDITNNLNSLKDSEKNEYATRILMFLEMQRKYISDKQMGFKNKSEFNNLLSYIESKKEQIKPFAWITDSQNDLRYIFSIDEDGVYKLEFANQLGNAKSIFIDDILISDISKVSIQKGFHRLRVIDSQVTEGYAPIIFVTKKLSTPNLVPPTLTFQQINPTRYVVHVENAKNAYILALSQQFNRNWKAYVASSNIRLFGKDELIVGNVTQLEAKKIFFDSDILRDSQHKLVSEYLHFQVNGFANGWFIDKTDGDYDIVIQYYPQYLFYIGAFITGALVLFEMVFLCVTKKL